MKSYLGLDMSLSSTGFFLLKEDGTNKNFEIRTEAGDFSCLVKRVRYIAEKVIEALKGEDVKLVLMEDYFMGSFAKSTIGLASLGTMVRDRLLMNGYRFVTATPTQIKKFETGSGTSKKGNMVKNVFKNHKFDTSSDNIADACAAAYLCKGYAEHAGTGSENFTKYQLEVLKKMPEMPEEPYDVSK